MRRAPQSNAPADAAARRQAKPVICYSVDQVPPFDAAFYAA